MSQSTAVDGPIAVIKVGGSILTSAKAYRRAAKFVRHTLQTAPHERLVVVVSAQEGTTDRLERGARKIVREPARAALDLLWSTGEIRSVALLALHLQTARRCSCTPEYPRSRPHGSRNRKRSWANSIARGTAARRAGKICGCGGAGIFGGEFRERDRIAGARRLGSDGGAVGRGLASLSLRID